MDDVRRPFLPIYARWFLAIATILIGWYLSVQAGLL